MVHKKYYNTILSLALSPCGNFLIAGDIYGEIHVFRLTKLLNSPTNVLEEDQKAKSHFVVEDGMQINGLLSTKHHLMVGTNNQIYGYDWNAVKNSKEVKVAWKFNLYAARDSFDQDTVNSLILNPKTNNIYAACGNSIYVVDAEHGQAVRTFSGHSDYIHNIFNYENSLVSGGEDGLVNIWDVRQKTVAATVTPYQNDDIARPELGKWIGAVGLNDDWLICGGGPKLSLWHFRSLTKSTIFPLDDEGIYYANLLDDQVLAGGRMDYFYNLSLNGDVISKISSSSATVYGAVYQMKPFRALCFAGLSPKIDLCSNFNYKDLVLNLA